MRRRLPLLGVFAALLAGCTVVHPSVPHHGVPASGDPLAVVSPAPVPTPPAVRSRLVATSAGPGRSTEPTGRPTPFGAAPVHPAGRAGGRERRPRRAGAPLPPVTGDALCGEGVRYGQLPPGMVAACRQALGAG